MKKQRLTVYISPEAKAKLEKIAKSDKRSISSAASIIIETKITELFTA